jgi:hypothetical protein
MGLVFEDAVGVGLEERPEVVALLLGVLFVDGNGTLAGRHVTF